MWHSACCDPENLSTQPLTALDSDNSIYQSATMARRSPGQTSICGDTERGERVEQLRQALLPRALAGEVTGPGGGIRKIPFASLPYIYARRQP
jgi:hypothetical protein